jgi:prophage DNA circulation protein
MFKADADEAAPIVVTTLNSLLSWAQTRGRTGSDLRTAVGDIEANVHTLLRTDVIGPPLLNCFQLAVNTGITLPQMDNVRAVAAAQTATLPGSIMIRDAMIEFALAGEGLVIANMTFVSRDDVEKVKGNVNAAFLPVEEEVADQMDAMTYRALISLHAAITFHLYATARPLPQMLRFEFVNRLPSLVMAYRLYADAGRADELRQENKVVHPAFSPSAGRGLSA